MNDFCPSGYDVTPEGQVINTTTNYVLKPKHNSSQYCYVRMKGKNYYIHRLVASKYIPNPENKPQVNHKDGNKDNNHVDNLEWTTAKENKTHAVDHNLVASGTQIVHSRLTEDDVRFIRANAKKTMKIKDLAAKYHVSLKTIGDIVNYRTWNHISD